MHFSPESLQKPTKVVYIVLIAYYGNESIKTTQTGQKIARNYFLVINVSNFTLVAIAIIATVFFPSIPSLKAKKLNLIFLDKYAN